MRVHNIKVLDVFADDILSEVKSFEVRLNDRMYQTGDIINYTVVDETGKMIERPLSKKYFQITFVLSGWGLKEEYVAFAQKMLEEEEANNALYLL